MLTTLYTVSYAALLELTTLLELRGLELAIRYANWTTAKLAEFGKID